VTKTVLHVGAGHSKNGAPLPASLRTPEWKERRLDLDQANVPHIVGSMLDMPAVADASVDAQGFGAVAGKRRPAAFDLWAVAAKGKQSDAEIRDLASRYLPA
jgi:hypothetical protein